MDFVSVTFILFILCAALVYYVVPRAARSAWLLACSYFYYLCTAKKPAFVFLLLGATVLTYTAARCMAATRRHSVKKLWFIGTLVACLGALGVFKYLGFFARGTEQLLSLFGASVRLPSFDFMLPLGISYFTFQALGYLIDVYRGKYAPEKDFLYYALFVSFFPCIVTGPIERADKLLPQLKREPRFHYDIFAGGAFRILLGFFKKLVLADTLAAILQPVFTDVNSYSGPVLLACCVLFSFRLYLDFSSACDIAVGTAACFGICVSENFRRPLAATTFTELWRRWHISLTGWLRDYVYIPLGGNRRGAVRTYINSLIIFLVSGLWHGAGWNYILWGAANGLLLCIGKATAEARKKLNAKNPFFTNSWLRPIGNGARTVFTVLLFSLCMVFFVQGLQGAAVSASFHYFGRMFTAGWGTLFAKNGFAAAMVTLGFTGTKCLVLLGGFVVTDVLDYFAMRGRRPLNLQIRKVFVVARWALYYAMVLGILYFGAFGQSAYIYQQY